MEANSRKYMNELKNLIFIICEKYLEENLTLESIHTYLEKDIEKDIVDGALQTVLFPVSGKKMFPLHIRKD